MVETELTTVFTMVGIGIAVLGLVAEHFYYQAKLAERLARVEQCSEDGSDICKDVKNISERLAKMETKVDLFWGALETQLPGVLLKGNPISSDSRIAQLLTQFNAGSLPRANYPELAELLEIEARNDEHTPGEKLAMIIMEATVKAKLQEE